MNWLLVLLPIWLQAQPLKPGTYLDLSVKQEVLYLNQLEWFNVQIQQYASGFHNILPFFAVH